MACNAAAHQKQHHQNSPEFPYVTYDRQQAETGRIFTELIPDGSSLKRVVQHANLQSNTDPPVPLYNLCDDSVLPASFRFPEKHCAKKSFSPGDWEGRDVLG